MNAEHASSDAFLQLRRSFERFCVLPDDVWAEVRRPWRFRSVRRGERITEEGEVERAFGIVLEGVQRVAFTTPNGEEQTVAFAYPHDYTGIPTSFFLQQPSVYGLEAQTNGRVLMVDYTRFAALMEKHRVLERWAWRLLATALAGRAKRERTLFSLAAKDRYERLLRESPHLLQLVPLQHVASYLGMTPETLSRVRASTSRTSNS